MLTILTAVAVAAAQPASPPTSPTAPFDHSKMDHSKMDHSKMGHSTMDGCCCCDGDKAKGCKKPADHKSGDTAHSSH